MVEAKKEQAVNPSVKVIIVIDLPTLTRRKPIPGGSFQPIQGFNG
uniref:Uncharacterized protein n=1 Tax=Rheinheimera sp. BAL341 TaxID=1708203 RepID=A0A486XM99_9GAMM